MAPNFIDQYHPLTARPFLRNNTYKEYIPCKQLRPYVTCFWSSEGIESRLCGIQDYAVMVEQGKEKEETVRFAVRFPFWAVRRFLDLDMSDFYNQTVDFDLLMPGCNDVFEEPFYCHSLEERIAWMESYLSGISIKRTASLVRYQHVWREVIQQNSFDIQEAAVRYGYADQSHLLGEFKRFHGLYPSQAKREALERR